MDVVGIDKKKWLPCCPVHSPRIKRLGKPVCSEQKLQQHFSGFDFAVTSVIGSGSKPSELTT